MGETLTQVNSLTHKNTGRLFRQAPAGIACYLYAGTGWANGAPSVSVGVDPFYLAKTIAALCVVLLIIFLLSRLVRTISRTGSLTNGPLKVLAAVSVGNREKLLIVQAGNEQLLVGVSPAGIVKLEKFDDPVVSEADTANASFKTQLAGMIGDKRR